jgi:uncharacterized protein YdcH (DUF465 family)
MEDGQLKELHQDITQVETALTRLGNATEDSFRKQAARIDEEMRRVNGQVEEQGQRLKEG